MKQYIYKLIIQLPKYTYFTVKIIKYCLLLLITSSILLFMGQYLLSNIYSVFNSLLKFGIASFGIMVCLGDTYCGGKYHNYSMCCVLLEKYYHMDFSNTINLSIKLIFQIVVFFIALCVQISVLLIDKDVLNLIFYHKLLFVLSDVLLFAILWDSYFEFKKEFEKIQ